MSDITFELDPDPGDDISLELDPDQEDVILWETVGEVTQGDINEAITRHVEAEDPHGDRAYADGLFSSIPADSVTSVNGETGAVTLDAADVGAEPAGAVAGHVEAEDPHGDRAYADGLFDAVPPSPPEVVSVHSVVTFDLPPEIVAFIQGPNPAPWPYCTAVINQSDPALNGVWQNMTGAPDTEGDQPLTRIADLPEGEAIITAAFLFDSLETFGDPQVGPWLLGHYQDEGGWDWSISRSVPSGGTPGYVLGKGDNDRVVWAPITDILPEGGGPGDVLSQGEDGLAWTSLTGLEVVSVWVIIDFALPDGILDFLLGPNPLPAGSILWLVNQTNPAIGGIWQGMAETPEDPQPAVRIGDLPDTPALVATQGYSPDEHTDLSGKFLLRYDPSADPVVFLVGELVPPGGEYGDVLLSFGGNRAWGKLTAADVGALPDDTVLPTGVGLSDATPADLGTAAAGSSPDAARADHVHDMPTAAEVGADPAGTAASAVAGVTTESLGAVPTSRTINGLDLTTNRTLTAADVGAPSGSGTSTGTNTGDQVLPTLGSLGAVPTSRTVNGKALSSDVTLAASDVGADPVGTASSAVSSERSATVTFTNKRITKRITTITSSATPTINTNNCDAVTITALAVDINTMTTNLSGAPANFDSLVFRIKDNGSPRAITWGASFTSRGATLPTSTTANKVTHVGFFYNSVALTWDCVACVTEA